MPTRHDVSAVPLQGGYLARRCPVVAHNDHDPTIAVEPLPPSPALRLRFERGNAFEAEVFAELRTLHPEMVMIDRSLPVPEREEATSRAMATGATLVLGGRLPADPIGRRVGEPDVLVRAGSPEADRWRYVPVDVKHRTTLSDRPDRTGAVTSTLERPWPGDRAELGGRALRPHEGDVLQLAHYHRMLEACGHHSPERVGGIIGKERLVVWHELDASTWRSGGRLRTALERYDFEFDFRLDIIAVALARASDPTIDPLVVPVRIAECAACEWWSLCGPVLERSDDVSLLPRVGWPQWRDLRLGGVTSQESLARLDWQTARLIDEGVDVRTFAGVAPTVPPDTPVADVIGRRRPRQAAVLAEAGFHTAADAARLDPTTIEVAYARGPSPLSGLASQIDSARARIGPTPAYRRRGVEAVRSPRAEVEIDVDMESSIDGQAYLWGALIAAGSDDSVYRPFVSWEPMDPAGLARTAVFSSFWRWLAAEIRRADSAGRTVAVYCYSRSAEEGQMRACLSEEDPGLASAVEGLLASDRWVDMLEVFDSQLITGDRIGLKVVARLAGFEWQDDDPDGAESMVWYEAAVAGDADARRRLIAYNEDDVRATRALREWMDVTSFPSIAYWRGRNGPALERAPGVG